MHHLTLINRFTAQLSLLFAGCVFAAGLLAETGEPVTGYEPFRFPLSGVIESTALETYVASARVPFPGVVITSETYVQVTERPGYEPSVTVFDVHEVNETAGGDTLLRRIAIDGVISSFEAETRQRIAATGFGRVLASRMPSAPGRVRMDGIITNEEMVSRFGLAGVIVSTNDEIQLAYVKEQDTSLPVPAVIEESVPEIMSDPEAIAERMPVFWENAAAMLRRFRPSVSTQVRSDTIDYDDGSNQTSMVAVASTSLNYDLSQKNWSAGGDYQLEKGVYLEGSREDFLNHELIADAERKLSSEHKVSLAGVIRHWRDKRVRQVIEDFNSQLVESHLYRSRQLTAGWDIGKERARLTQNIKVSAENSATSRTNDNGYNLQRRDLGYTAVYRVSRRLTYLVDASASSFDYERRLDSREIVLLPGVDAWSSRRLRTLFHLGAGSKRHPETGESISELLWRLESTWRPRRATTLTLESAKEFLEVFERDGEFVDGEFGTQEFGRVSWLQRWAPLWQSEMSLTYQQRTFESAANDESAVQWVLGGQYQATPRLTFRGDGVYTSQQSEQSRDYDRWTVTLKADLRF